MAHDASHFLLYPSAVVTAADAGEVGRLFAPAAARRTSLTFRAGGTSLSGQAGTEAILVDVRRHFRDIEVLDDGDRVRVGPGATVRQVNARLTRTDASSARTRPARSPARWAASSPTTPAAWPAAPPRTPTAPSSP